MSITPYRVAISPGHFKEKPGATRYGVTEFDLTTVWVEKIAGLCDVSEEYEVHLIEPTSLPIKVNQINSLDCDIAIEIHFNAASNDNVRGCEILHYPKSRSGFNAAMNFQLRLAKAMNTKSRGVKGGWYRMDRPGIIDFYGDEDGDEMPHYFLRATNCTALIFKPEFMGQLECIIEHEDAGCQCIADVLNEMAAKEIRRRTKRQ